MGVDLAQRPPTMTEADMADSKPEKDDLEVDDLDTVAGGGADPKMQPDNPFVGGSVGCLKPDR